VASLHLGQHQALKRGKQGWLRSISSPWKFRRRADAVGTVREVVGTGASRVPRQWWLAGGHDSLPAGVTVSSPRRFFLVLAWMITAYESRTVASYRESGSTEPGPDFEVVHERDRGAFAVRTRPPI
jgi:hypothetical protein